MGPLVVSAALVDVLAIVSSDPTPPLSSARLNGCGLARSVQLFRSGAELLKVLNFDPSLRGCIVLVDAVVEDIGPLNLVDAIRAVDPTVDTIVAMDHPDGGQVQRAMLAGARAAVQRDCSDSDLEVAMRRVVAARPMKASAPTLGVVGRSGSIVAVIGARGGAGKSTLATTLAYLAARGGVATALVDLDFQFGDLGLLAHDNPAHTLPDMLAGLGATFTASMDDRRTAYGLSLGENLTLYSGEPELGRAEAAFAQVGAGLRGLSQEHELLVVNTGAYWTLGHASLLDSADHVVCVTDQSVAGVRATRRLLATIGGVGIGPSRFSVVVNRTTPQGAHAHDLANALGIERVWMVPDGGREIAVALDSGSVEALIDSHSAYTPAVGAVLDDIAGRTGIAVHGMASMRSALRRPDRRWGRRR